MNAIRIEELRVWLRQRVAVKLLVMVLLTGALSVIFFRDFWRSLPVTFSPAWIFGQSHAAPWGVLALCLLFLWLKKRVVRAQMRRRTNPAYVLLGSGMLALAILVPFSPDFLVFQVLLASLGVFTIIFGGASLIPAISLAIYGLAVFIPLFIERFYEYEYARAAIASVMGLMTALSYPLQNQGQWISFVSRSGEPVTIAITAACAGPATMGVFMALFALMTMDTPLPPQRAAWTFLFGLVGTWFQSFIRIVFLLLLGYYSGENALQTAHFWTIYILFPLWFLVFAYVYLRQVKRPRTPWGRQPMSGMSTAGG